MSKQYNPPRAVSLKPEDAMSDQLCDKSIDDVVADHPRLPEWDTNAKISCRSMPILLNAVLNGYPSRGTFERYLMWQAQSIAEHDVKAMSLLGAVKDKLEKYTLAGDEGMLLRLGASLRTFNISTYPGRHEFYCWDMDNRVYFDYLSKKLNISVYLVVIVYLTKSLLTTNKDLGSSREKLVSGVSAVWDEWVTSSLSRLELLT